MGIELIEGVIEGVGVGLDNGSEVLERNCNSVQKPYMGIELIEGVIEGVGVGLDNGSEVLERRVLMYALQ